MASVEADELAARDGIAEIILVRAGGITFRSDAKELAFNCVEIVARIERLREDCVERLSEATARAGAVDGRVFVAVRDPDVGDARRAERAADRRADPPAGDSVVNPELTNSRIAVSER